MTLWENEVAAQMECIQNLGEIGPDESSFDPALFKQGMRTLASGVSIVSTMGDDGPAGLLSTSVSSVSIDPPMLLVCINESASAHHRVQSSGAFCVNVLADTDQPIAERFGSAKMRAQRFRDRDWLPLVTGAPALAGCLASFDCKCVGNVEAASHTIFIGQVVGVKQWTEGEQPLLYWDGQYRSGMNGLHN